MSTNQIRNISWINGLENFYVLHREEYPKREKTVTLLLNGHGQEWLSVNLPETWPCRSLHVLLFCVVSFYKKGHLKFLHPPFQTFCKGFTMKWVFINISWVMGHGTKTGHTFCLNSGLFIIILYTSIKMPSISQPYYPSKNQFVQNCFLFKVR